MRKTKNLKTETDRSENGHGQIHVKYGARRGKNEGWVFCYVPTADSVHVTNLQHVEDIKHILAITEGRFGKPVTRSSRFINANHPPKNATKEELEAIARFWGDPDDAKPLTKQSFNASARKYRERMENHGHA